MAVAPIALALAAHPKLDSYDLSSLRYVMWCATPVTAERRRGRHRQGGRELGDRLRHQRVAGDRVQFARRGAAGHRRTPGARVSTSGSSRSRTASLSAPGEVGEIQARSDSVMAGYLPDEATRTGVFRRLVPHRGRRLPRRRRLVADHRPGQGDDQGARIPGRACRDRGGAARASGGSTTARCSASTTRPTAKRSSPRSQRTVSVDPDELVALVAERLASYKQLSRVVIVPEIPRLPSGKVLRRVLKEQHGCPSDG